MFIICIIYYFFIVYYLRNNLLEQINPQWDSTVSKNTYFQRILIGNREKNFQ